MQPLRPELNLGPERAKPCGLEPGPGRASPSLRREEIPAQPEILVALPYNPRPAPFMGCCELTRRSEALTGQSGGFLADG